MVTYVDHIVTSFHSADLTVHREKHCQISNHRIKDLNTSKSIVFHHLSKLLDQNSSQIEAEEMLSVRFEGLR